MAEITLLLDRFKSGDRAALDELMPLVYRELRVLALNQFRREGSTHTLQPTALIHEVYLKLVKGRPPAVDGRAHFLAIAARLMRQILVDHSRRRNRAKRTPVSLLRNDNSQAANVIALDDALTDLSKDAPRRAELIEMHYFGGMTAEESAMVLEMSVHVVRKEVRLGQAWLRRRLNEGPAAAV